MAYKNEEHRRKCREAMIAAQKIACTGEHLKKRNEARRWWLDSEENKIMLKSMQNHKGFVEKANERDRIIKELNKLGRTMGIEVTSTKRKSTAEVQRAYDFLLKLAEKRAKMEE